MKSQSSPINPADYEILVVDDEESVRKFLGELLSGWGFQSKIAANAEEALEIIENSSLPHIIIADVRMGGMTGIELAAEVKKLSKEVEVIIMTSQGSFDTAVQATKAGVYDYLGKPFDNLEDVRSVILHVCERIYLRYYNEFLLDELTHKKNQLQGLADMTDELSKNFDVAKTIEIGCDYISLIFKGAPVVFFQLLPSERTVVATARAPKEVFAGTQPKFPIPENVVNDAKGFAKFINELPGNSLFTNFLNQSDQLNPANLPYRNAGWHLQGFYTREIPRGLFAIKTPTFDKDLLHRFLMTTETFFENALLHVRVLENSIRDGLTKLFNVRYFKEKFDEELKKVQRIKHPLSLIFLDIDHFKHYNDHNGHPAGDALLVRIADLLKSEFRSTDIVARYGGEEFVIMLPHTGLNDAMVKAERLRMRVEKEKFAYADQQPLGKLSISIGVSEYPTHADDIVNLLQVCDNALYEAKKTRNSVKQATAKSGYIPAFQSFHVETNRINKKT
ncbi:MAG: diguanylate cyclase [Proteobacteria bacterium]|nr:diguanylate cyclase [Pseudomonadota bacterium]